MDNLIIPDSGLFCYHFRVFCQFFFSKIFSSIKPSINGADIPFIGCSCAVFFIPYVAKVLKMNLRERLTPLPFCMVSLLMSTTHGQNKGMTLTRSRTPSPTTPLENHRKIVRTCSDNPPAKNCAPKTTETVTGDSGHKNGKRTRIAKMLYRFSKLQCALKHSPNARRATTKMRT